MATFTAAVLPEPGIPAKAMILMLNTPLGKDKVGKIRFDCRIGAISPAGSQCGNVNTLGLIVAPRPMRARPGLVTLAILLVVALILPATPVLAEWPMDGGGPEHTGEQLTPLIGAANQWEVMVDGELLCPPSTAYSKLYLGTSDGHLKVLDESDGQLLWEVEVGDSICATPLIESQTAFVPTGNVLHAIALSNKTDKWTFTAVGDLRGSPVLFNDLIYVGSEDKHVYAIDKYDGTLEWSLKLDDVIASSASVSAKVVIIGTEAGTVYGIHRTEGEEEWQADVGSSVSTAACISGSTAMVGTYGGRLHGIDVDDGELLWTFPHPAEPALDPILTTPVTNSGLVYFGSDGLYCLEVRNGLKAWYHETGDTVRGSPAIVESYLVFGSYDGLVRCLDKNTGRVVWRFSADTVFRSGVSID
jgi:outer membrane protein assembly factor BamB